MGAVFNGLWPRGLRHGPRDAEKAFCGKGFGPLCLRTPSVEWNVPGKYGPHGELFFFLIQTEPATMPGSETFSPFFAADIRTPLFSADVLKKCALIGMLLIAEEGSVESSGLSKS